MLKNFQEIMRGDVEHALLHLWSDELSEAEAMAIRARVENNPNYREEFYGSLEILGSMEELAGDGEIRKTVPELKRLVQKHRSRRKTALGIAASVLVACGGALIYFSPLSERDQSHQQMFFSRIGEQRTIELDDSSVITLNTASQLVVDYSEQVRRILLERGEAYLEVAEDSKRPFVVNLGVVSVTAVGTAFNIRKDPEHYQMAVIEGVVMLHGSTDEESSSSSSIPVDDQVAVFSTLEPHRVEAGWVAEFDLSSNRLRTFRPESMERYQEWRHGLLSFYPEPLHRVVHELNRYSRKRILIEDPSVMGLKVYTTVRIDEIDFALNGLEQLLPIKVTRHYDRVVITASAGN